VPRSYNMQVLANLQVKRVKRKHDLLSCEFSRERCNRRMSLTRIVSGHLLVSEPKRVYEDICRNVGLPSHHAITDIVSVIKKKQ
jgi:hypothetical protein